MMAIHRPIAPAPREVTQLPLVSNVPHAYNSPMAEGQLAKNGYTYMNRTHSSLAIEHGIKVLMTRTLTRKLGFWPGRLGINIPYGAIKSMA
jgi:hypothetical protein